MHLSVRQTVIIIFLILIFFFSAPELNKYDDAWLSEAEDKNEEEVMGKRKREEQEEVDGEVFGEVDVVNEEVEMKEEEVDEEVEKKEEEASEEITTVRTREGEEVRMRLQDVPRDGHCLLHAVLVALEDSCDSRPPSLERLKDYLYETATDYRYRYEMFLEEEDFPYYERDLDKYIRNNKFNSSLGDIMPLILADCLGLVINIRRGDQWNQIVPQEGANETEAEIFLRLECYHYQAYVRETEEWTWVAMAWKKNWPVI